MITRRLGPASFVDAVAVERGLVPIEAVSAGGTTISWTAATVAMTPGTWKVNRSASWSGVDLALTATSFEIARTIEWGAATLALTARAFHVDRTIQWAAAALDLTAQAWTVSRATVIAWSSVSLPLTVNAWTMVYGGAIRGRKYVTGMLRRVGRMMVRG